MKKKLLAMLILPVAALSFVACGGEEKKEETDAAAPKSEYTDGTYEVETKPDDRGGKINASVKFADGKIVEVKYNESNDKGNKRDDEEYNTKMKEASGVGPAEFEVKFEEAVMEKQSAEIDSVTGATSSSANAKLVFQTAIDNAKAGKTDKAVIELPAK